MPFRFLVPLAVLGAVVVPAGQPATAASGGDLPVVSPTPQSISRAGDPVEVPDRVRLVTGADTDPIALQRLRAVLRSAGAEQLTSGPAALTVRLGAATRADVKAALGSTPVPAHAEGYALRVGRSTIALGGVDAAGQFYAVQTLRQLVQGHRIAGAGVSDFPSMPLRGSIEGFYGPPWTPAERLDHLDFLGDTKANTYVYAPKDDPYHREQWREPYPAEKLAELTALVDRAVANHVRFTFALSPGNSICYSDPADTAALLAKFQVFYDLGVRSFSIPLDDISYGRWNCAADQTKYGAPGRGPAAKAQVDLLNTVQRQFIATHEGANPLQMVPTEYGDLTDTAYKQTIRTTLDGAVQVMWTGTDVVPPEITNAQASRAAELFGRKVFVWDNYPVNDFGRTAGRLLLAPYDKREAGLSDHLSGIVSNPMNQSAASKLAVFTMNDFSWNDRGYNRAVSGRQAALYVAGGNSRTADAVQFFVDLNHAAPTFGSQLWQPQSPVLKGKLDRFWASYETEPRAAISEFRTTTRQLEQAPAVIRAGVPDRLFLHDASRWLDATQVWARSMAAGLDVLSAIDAGDADRAATARKSMEALAAAAGQIVVDPAEHHQRGPVKIADPYIEEFVTAVQARHDESLGLPPLVELAKGKTATQVSDYDAAYSADKSVDGDLFNFSTTGGTEPQPWWQVDLGSSADLEQIKVYNRTDCCADRVKDYHVLVSDQPFTGTLADNLAKPGVWSHHETAQAGNPTAIPVTARGRYVRVWLATTVNTELNLAEVQVLGRVS
ncbi:beta-N-acetylglucosaminidase domain-containing protein [Kribbella sp. NBC_01245]|uniref:beta-N-acetylglucosaminidase domain-containing protein n=1 Tax=Kribbella sp. NBC_01245 TaxID=2903578 RepID=UPI002E29216A|nr:beta-N-acetylglucosaminidase domain-containing protein [Kribbella sp. NBC_01245]